MVKTFQDRCDAGRQLADKLIKYKNTDAIVIALPRGGVLVGYEISRILHLPLDVLVVRKIGAPGDTELGIGAIAPGVCFLERKMVSETGISREYIDQAAVKEAREMVRREKLYRGNHAMPEVAGRTVIIVDDGLATGVSAKAAILALKKQHPGRIVFATPIASRSGIDSIDSMVDYAVCILKSDELDSIGEWYEDFHEVHDQEVVRWLQKIYIHIFLKDSI